MRTALATLSALALLAACGTPQEQCIAANTRDLRVVERLIGETETNLRRGYALEQRTVTRTMWVECERPIRPGGLEPEPGRPRLCLTDVDETVTRPVAIDLAAEARKLDGLRQKQRELTAAAQGAIAACKAAYPEET